MSQHIAPCPSVSPFPRGSARGDCASSSLGEHFPLCPSQGLMASLEQNLSMLLVFPCPRAECGHTAKQRIHPWLVSRSWVSSFAVCAQVMLPSSLRGSDNVSQTLRCSGGFGSESSLWNQSCVVLKGPNKWRCRTKLPSDCCVKWECVCGLKSSSWVFEAKVGGMALSLNHLQESHFWLM